ncbi:hypothetical protein DTO013E5_3572 [Penicillium roqueforti]|uniref:Large ribosomal subunit protein bL21m n=1 Tax=Penicillium roqueforti (strain FM164) TaxID=1365484 RepID=W6QDF8_PENRF|nr:hypothetical protein CBS147355_6139 [Penicillium roqueforti]CDM32219.1 unnamed protein product [Penicillium roqueforti FM164]KAI2707631.1 hypothetical protein CBS147332_6689 [Penicillium roqueforti]KAI2738209.1 hypothetical protein DTO013F2_9640 [Penicillium roqueforti]KAI2742500.1 hypothetical protein DTO012A1_3801 [Penicillium roqueforti]
MFSRSALRGLASEVRWTAPSTISSAAPLQQRACLHQSASLMNSQPQSQSASSHPESPLSATPRAQDTQPKTRVKAPTFDETIMTPQTRAHVPIAKQPVAPTFTSPLEVTKSLMSQLPHLAGQKPHYIVAQLHARPYLLTEGDHIRLPFLMPKVKAGDILRFNRASALGSRDFTMKGSPTIDERIYECRVRVTGVDAEPLRIKEKTKRRQRHVKQAKSKHRYTLMRVMDVRVKTPDELLAEGAVIVDDAADSSVIEPRS